MVNHSHLRRATARLRHPILEASVLLLALSLFIAGCDTHADVLSTDPVNGATGVSQTTDVVVEFSTRMDVDTATNSANYEVEGSTSGNHNMTASLDETGRFVTLELAEGDQFNLSEVVTVGLTDRVQSNAGSTIDEDSFSFTITGVPVGPPASAGDFNVVSSDPDTGDGGESLRPVMTVAFDRAVTESSVTSNSVVVRGDTSGEQDVNISFGNADEDAGTPPELVLSFVAGSDGLTPGEWVSITLTDDIASPQTEGEIEAGLDNFDLSQLGDAGREIIENNGGLDGNQAPDAEAAETGPPADYHLVPTTIRFQVGSAPVEVPEELDDMIGLNLPSGEAEDSFVAAVVADFRPVSAGAELATLSTDGLLRLYRRSDTVWSQLDAIQIPDTPVDMRHGDLDGDGHPELVILTIGVGTSPNAHLVIAEFLGDDWSLVTGEPLPVGSEVNALEIGDMDNDTRPDIVIAHSAGALIARQVAPEPTVPFRFDYNAAALADVGGDVTALQIADLDRDGRLDVVAASGSDRSTRVFGNGRNLQFSQISKLEGELFDGQLQVADWEGDGDLDIIGVTLQGLTTYTYASGVPADWEGQVLTLEGVDGTLGASFPAAFVVGDLTGDTASDLVLYEERRSRVFVRTGVDFAEPENSDLLVDLTASTIALVDLDSDHALDVLLFGEGDETHPQILSSLSTSISTFATADYEYSVPERLNADISDEEFRIDVVMSLSQAVSELQLSMKFSSELVLDSVIPNPSMLPGATVTTAGVGGVTITPDGTFGPASDVIVATYVFRQDTPAVGRFAYRLEDDVFEHPDLPGATFVTAANRVTLARNGAVVGVATTRGVGIIDVESAVESVTDLTCELNFDSSDETDEVVLNWTNPRTYTSIQIHRNGVLQVTQSGSPTSYTDPDPVPGGVVYSVTGFVDDDRALATECEVGVVLSVTELECTRQGTQRVDLTWFRGFQFYDGFIVSRDGAEIATLSGTADEYQDSDTDNNGHVYEVVGFDFDDNRSAPATCSVSDQNANFTEPVTNVGVSRVGDNTIAISWTNGENYNDEVGGISLLRIGPGNLETTIDLLGSATSYLDEDLVPGTYTYEVTGVAGGRPSSAVASDAVDAKVPAPFDLVCSLPGGNDALLSWENAYEYDLVVVERTRQGESPSTITEITGTQSTFEDDDLEDGTYTYTVLGVYDDGERLESDLSGECQVIVESAIQLADVDTAPGFAATLDVTAKLTDDLVGVHFAVEYDSERFVVDLTDGGLPDVQIPGYPDELTEDMVFDEEVEGSNTERRLTVRIDSGLELDAGEGVVLATVHGQVPADLSAVNSGPFEFTRVIPGVDDETAGEPLLRYAGDQEQLLTGTSVRDGDFSVFGDVMYVDSLAAEPGDTIEVAIIGTYDQGLSAYSTIVDFDPDVLTFVELTREGTISEDLGFAFEVENDGQVGIILSSTNVNVFLEPDIDQVLAIAVFEVNDDAEAGTVTPIEFGAAEAGGNIFVPIGANFSIEPGENVGDLLLIDGVVLVGSLDAPEGLSCEVDGQDVTLEWSNNGTYESISITRNGLLLATLDGDVESFVDEDVPGGEYSYTVQAEIVGLELDSISCDDVTVVEPPDPVEGLTCVVNGAGEAELSWVNAEDYDSVQILRDGEEIALLTEDETSYTDADLTNGSTDYQLVAERDELLSEVESCTVVKAPPVPEDFTCDVSGNTVTLTWVIPADVTYDSIEVYRNDELLATLAGDLVEYEDLGVPPTGIDESHEYQLAGIVEDIASDLTELGLCMVTIEATPPDSIQDLACEQVDDTVSLTWSLGDEAYDAIIVSRGGVRIAELDGDAVSLDDTGVVAGNNDYSVVGEVGELGSEPVECTVDFVVETGPEFIRGDANGNGSLTIADALAIFNYSVGGGAVITCLDAGDANDDGSLGIPDGSYINLFIFGEGSPPPPPAPYPDCGVDTTEDDDGEDLGCEGPVEACDP